MPDHARLAAQVLLSGAPDDPLAATAQHAAAAPPHAADAAKAVRQFKALGFTVGPVVGYSFSIEGDAELFRSRFGVSLVQAADGSLHEHPSGAGVDSLSLARLPASLQRQVKRVLFSAPPAFGPGTMP